MKTQTRFRVIRDEECRREHAPAWRVRRSLRRRLVRFAFYGVFGQILFLAGMFLLFVGLGARGAEWLLAGSADWPRLAALACGVCVGFVAWVCLAIWYMDTTGPERWRQ